MIRHLPDFREIALKSLVLYLTAMPISCEIQFSEKSRHKFMKENFVAAQCSWSLKEKVFANIYFPEPKYIFFFLLRILKHLVALN